MTNGKPSTPALTNPLQNNNAAVVAIGYAAGIIAAKFPIFDLATWNYIFLTVGGLIVTIAPYILNRRTAVVTTVANMPDVHEVQMNKTSMSGVALAQSANTPDNVVIAK